MTTILLLAGSQRRDSLNKRLVHYLAPQLATHCVIDIVDPTDVHLPLFNQDLETNSSVIRHVEALHRRFSAGDGIVVSCPEYNGQLTPYLKNIVDWVSRLPYIDRRHANAFEDHPVLLCSASTGWSGGAVAIPHARALFGYIGCVVMGDTINIPYADQAWNGYEYNFDPLFDDRIAGSLGRLLSLSQTYAQCRRPALAAA